MANIELLILLVLGFAVLSYIITKLNAFLGAVVTIVATTIVFSALAYYGLSMNIDTTSLILPFMSFEQTYLGTYFVLIIVFIYMMVSFFHPYYVDHYRYKAAYHFLFLLSLAAVMGAFYSSNLVQLFFFFELIVWSTLFLIPMGKSKEAAVMYYGFSAFGSLAMFFGILVVYQTTGSTSINALTLISGNQALVVLISFMLAGFAKLGAFPLHVWLPVAHSNAPHPFSPVLSGALVKLGAFISILALVRIAPATELFEAIGLPFAQYAVAILGAITIVFGTLMAIKEDDAKKLLAYSSMSHGGYILVAFAVLDGVGFAGGLYHILAHALASAAAFMAIGAVARATGTTKMKELGGMIHKMPITYLVYLVAIISMAGIPPMGGFISKWLIFQTVINQGLIFIGIAVFFGSIGSFLYVFRPLAALFLGQELSVYKDKVKEAPILMLIPMIILTLMNMYTGILPSQIMGFINQVIRELGYPSVVLNGEQIVGYNGVLNPPLIAIVFGFGVVVAFIIFILLKKSRKVGLMDTYTAANFVHNEELLHYSVDFYAPLERLYEKHSTKMQEFYEKLALKVKELGRFAKYLFMSHYVEVAVFWILSILIFVLWGEI
jgi:NADH-quinone oxidoreductase subunit M